MKHKKIYIHHHYDYELFWYFFHGVDIKPIEELKKYDFDSKYVFDGTLPTWLPENRYNRNNLIYKNVTILCKYKDVKLTLVFCHSNFWNKTDGFHLFDMSMDIFQKGDVSDRGFNSNLQEKNNIRNHELFRESEQSNNHIHYMYLDWEGHDPFIHYEWYKTLPSNVKDVFVDETYTKSECDKHNFVFTNLIWSFLSPNTLNMRDYYFFHDYLKYKDDYKYRLNFPIRRFYGTKVPTMVAYSKIRNKHMGVTHSSFHDTWQISMTDKTARDFVFSQLNDTQDFIQKRGYGINDWGGEWNSNNMNENMWRMFGISDVVLLYERNPNLFKQERRGFKEDWYYQKNGYSWITEKTVSHILVGKPFIPIHYETIRFYEEQLQNYGYNLNPYPLQYENIDDILPELAEIISDDKRWFKLRDELKIWVEEVREKLIDLIHNNNSYLDIVIDKKLDNQILL